MMSVVVLLLVLAGLGLLAHIAGFLTVLSRPQAATYRGETTLPPLTFIKPIKGGEEELEDNLISFFVQDYPAPFEIIFACDDMEDPGLNIARQISERYAAIPTQFVHSDSNFGLNPKIGNLAAATAHANYDLILHTDANVRLTPSYATSLVAEHVSQKADLTSSWIAGCGERSLGAAIENLHLTTHIITSIEVAEQHFQTPCVIGKSMLLRRSVLEEVGGFGLVKDHLGEDYMLGKAFAAARKKVYLSTVPVQNVNVHTTTARFIARHQRWLQMRVVIDPRSFAVDLLMYPVGWATLALMTGFATDNYLWPVATWLVVVPAKTAMEAQLLKRTRGSGLGAWHIPVALVRDFLMMFVAWPRALISRRINWRGTPLRLGRESSLHPPPRVP